MKRPSFPLLSTTFSIIVVLSNLLSAKLINGPIPIPAGLIFYPFSFLLLAITTELYGAKEAKKMVLTGLFMNLLSFAMIEISLLAPSLDKSNHAFEEVFALSSLRIFASLAAYLIADISGIGLFSLLKRLTKGKHLFFRALTSFMLSQAIDTFVIDILFLYFGLGMNIKEVICIMFFSYLYKMSFGILITPLLYLFTSHKKKVLNGSTL